MKKLIFSIVAAGTFLPLTLHAGCFDGDCLNGPGSMLADDGSVYVGQWKDGVHHGPGSLFLPDGTFLKGEFANGAFVKGSEQKPGPGGKAEAGSGNKTAGDYPEASTRLLTNADLAGRSTRELNLMRNEIFARHSYDFSSPAMKKHFSAQSWYTPLFKEVYSMLSDIERANIKLIKERTRQLK